MKKHWKKAVLLGPDWESSQWAARIAEEVGFERKTKKAKEIEANDLKNILRTYKEYKSSKFFESMKDKKDTLEILNNKPSCFLIGEDLINDRIDATYYFAKHVLDLGVESCEVKDVARLSRNIVNPSLNPTKEIKYVQFSHIEKYLGDITGYYELLGNEAPSRAKQMLDVYDEYGGTVLGGIRLSKDEDYTRYGYVQGKEIGQGVWRVDRLIEKPGKDRTPSDLAIVANYLLTPDIFPILDKQTAGTGGEFYLPEAIDILAKQKPVYALEIKDAHYYDTGNKIEYMKTVVEFGLQHPDINGEFREFLKGLKI